MQDLDLELEYERVTKQRYEDFQEWLNKCPLVVTDYQDYTNEFVITFNLMNNENIYYSREICRLC